MRIITLINGLTAMSLALLTRWHRQPLPANHVTWGRAAIEPRIEQRPGQVEATSLRGAVDERVRDDLALRRAPAQPLDAA